MLKHIGYKYMENKLSLKSIEVYIDKLKAAKQSVHPTPPSSECNCESCKRDIYNIESLAKSAGG